MPTQAKPLPLVLILRCSACIFMLAWVGVLMPTSWMQHIHALGETGPWADTPFFLYLACCTSALFGFYGIMTWFLSNDVVRYLPLIRFLAWSGLPMAVVLTYIGYAAGLPPWWYGTEGVAVVVISLLWLWGTKEFNPKA